MKNLVYNLIKNILPYTSQQPFGCCELCLENADLSGFLCQPCRNDLAVAAIACSQCAEPISSAGRCARCQQEPPAFDYGHSSYLYQPPLSDWLLAAKDHTQLQWLNRLSWLMQQRPPHTIGQADGLVYVPSSSRRLLQRGFNPAEMLARKLAAHYRLPLYENAVYKKGGADQRGLTAKQRKRNQQKSFIPGPQTFDNGHLIIIDDVITTGATADAVAKILKAQGAGIIGVWSLARTPAKAAQEKSAQHKSSTLS